MNRRTLTRISVLSSVVLLAFGLASCGSDGKSYFGGPSSNGSGTGGSGGNNGGGSSSGYTAGVYQPASNFEARCVAPRSGTDPATGKAYPDVSGTVTDQNNWLRSMTNELYLWYREVPDLNPSQYATPDYFDLLKTSQQLNGAPKDKFHFTYPTAEWEALSNSGAEVTYGVSFALVSTSPPRRAVVAYVQPTAPTATVNAGMTRGVEILQVDGVDLVNDNTSAGVDKINAGLFPSNAGESHTFVVKDLNGTQRTVALQAASVTSKPVLVTKVLSSTTGPVGYILFNDHIATAESGLFNAITTLKQANVQDLVLDIRYNGGGYLDIASELAYMIAGPTQTAGQTFEKLQFNDKNPTTDPVTGQALTPTLFHTTSLGFDPNLPKGSVLPTLNLAKVYVLTGGTTCSASESVINSLRGVGVQVIQVGTTTCGKPYGFYPLDNCGTTYFTIQFRGVNAKNYGDYTNGFVPSTSPSASDASQVQGCTMADDFTHDLGDAGENQLEAALSYRLTGVCTALATQSTDVHALGVTPISATSSAIVPKPIWRMNRVLRP